MSGNFLIVRREDLVLLGVRWSGFQLRGAAVRGGPPMLEATTDDARVVLTFPPQHIAEEVAGGPPMLELVHLQPVWRACLAGPSRLAVSFSRGDVVPLDIAGLLAAVQGNQILPSGSVPGEDDTAIEIPWRLLVSLESRTGSGRVRSDHHSRPIESPSGMAQLWRSHIRSNESTYVGEVIVDAGLALRPVDAALAGTVDPFPVPLTQSNRLEVFQRGRSVPAPASRLELSCLGGSLSAKADWGTFAWEHEATLGRDRRVRTLSKGVCYPFGHRAEYLELTERTFDPAVAETAPIAVLRKLKVLTVTEPLRGPVADHAALGRAFPFSEVEITTRTFTDLADPLPYLHPRPSPELAELKSAIADLEWRLADALKAALAVLYGPGTTMADLVPMSVDEALRWDIHRYGGESPPSEVQIYYEVEEELVFLQSVAAGVGLEQIPLFFWPRTSDGELLTFPMRCTGKNGDVNFSLPMIFVADIDLPPVSIVPGFVSLTDGEVARLLEQEYARESAGVVELPGPAIDLVRSDGRQPGDVFEVHALNIVGVPHAGRFRPRLGAAEGSSTSPTWGVQVALPALRTLLGDESLAKLKFAESYLLSGESEDVVLQAADGTIGIDFTSRADRSGGLVSPKLTANAISRAHGLVKANLDAGGLALDPATLFDSGASLLGFDLRSVLTGLTAPPSMVSILETGKPPVVRMVWPPVPLVSQPPLVASDRSKLLDLSVESSPEAAVTTCTVTDVSLVLPPNHPLLELRFGSLTFTQEAGHAPTLEIKGVSATFLGELELLKKLGDAVSLGNATPNVDVSQSGIVARYALPVPEVKAAAFVMRGIVFHAAVEIPFDPRPVSVSLAFASRANPFNLSVLMFGGGGYVDLQLDHRGLQRLEASLEFGASVAVDFIVASGEVHALGGIRYIYTQTLTPPVTLTGFLRIGGSVEVLGLVSVSVELVVILTYEPARTRMVGRATLVVEIDLTLYSDSVELDSGDWVLVGGDDDRPALDSPSLFEAEAVAQTAADSGLAAWRRYREAFAKVAA